LKQKLKNLWRSIVFKSVLTIVMVLVVFTMIVNVIGYTEVTDALLDQYADGAFRTAGISAHFLDPNQIEGYLKSGGESEEYQAVLSRLQRICNSSGSTFIYVIIPDRTDYQHITFLFSTMNQETSYSRYPFGYVRHTTNSDYAQKYKKLCEEGSARELVIRDKGYIETDPHITAMIPLIDSAGKVQAILCVQRQMDVLINSRNSFLSKVVAAMLCIAVLVIIGLSLTLHHQVLLPVRIIAQEASRFASENISTGEKLTKRIRSKDEIGHLAGAIDQMEEQIQSYVSNLTSITAERERISTELTLAARIQEDMLPNTFPAFPERKDFDIYAYMNPAREIGGDFYSFFLVDENHLCMVMADVSGKGVPAALFMMASIIVLVDNARIGLSAAEILQRANEAICMTNREDMFVTVWLGILDLKTGIMNCANAGHEYPTIREPGGKFALFKDPHGFVIGGMEGARYRSYELQLKPGSKVFVYTDGVPEATDEKLEMFGTGRMLDALNMDPDASPEEILGHVQQSVEGFVGSAEQFDDMTMLCMEYKGCEGVASQSPQKG
jgi:sigma-B regulation protein RsbU (phosphoserine phosphatase)